MSDARGRSKSINPASPESVPDSAEPANRHSDATVDVPASGASRPGRAALEPKSIGRYQLVKKLGEGGMGQVWLAEQTAPVRREVALKLIKAGMYDDSVLLRFQSERQSLAIMDHPSIA